MGECTMEHVIRVELRTDTTHAVAWLDAALKPKAGRVLVCKDDPRPWTVVPTYTRTAQKMSEVPTNWKVGGSVESLVPESEVATTDQSHLISCALLTGRGDFSTLKKEG